MSKKRKKKKKPIRQTSGYPSNQKQKAVSSKVLASRSRHQLIDVLRGSAILLMFIYHFCYDLNYFGAISTNFNQEPFWLNFRTLIVSMFLLIMGISLFLSTINGLNKTSFFKRFGLLILYSSIISLVTYLVFPKEMIFFGILHFIAAATVIGLIFVRLYYINLVIGSALILLSMNFNHALFDEGAWQWFGLMTKKPITIDYVPLIPWFGVVLVGLFIGKFVYNHSELSKSLNWESSNPVFQILAFGGRHSLHIYILHQPVFLGILFLFFKLI